VVWAGHWKATFEGCRIASALKPEMIGHTRMDGSRPPKSPISVLFSFYLLNHAPNHQILWLLTENALDSQEKHGLTDEAIAAAHESLVLGWAAAKDPGFSD